MFQSHSVGLCDRFQNRQWLWSPYHIQQFPQLPDTILIAIDFSKIVSCPMRWAATATHTAWHIFFSLSIANRSWTYVQLNLSIVMCKNNLNFRIHNICRCFTQIFSLPLLIYLHYFNQSLLNVQYYLSSLRWAPEHFPLIWGENQWSISSCLACLGQVNLAEALPLQVKPQPISTKLQTRIWYEHEAMFLSGNDSVLAVDLRLGNSWPSDAVSSPHWLDN